MGMGVSYSFYLGPELSTQYIQKEKKMNMDKEYVKDIFEYEEYNNN
jgi:hypothetical protein